MLEMDLQHVREFSSQVKSSNALLCVRRVFISRFLRIAKVELILHRRKNSPTIVYIYKRWNKSAVCVRAKWLSHRELWKMISAIGAA